MSLVRKVEFTWDEDVPHTNYQEIGQRNQFKKKKHKKTLGGSQQTPECSTFY